MPRLARCVARAGRSITIRTRTAIVVKRRGLLREEAGVFLKIRVNFCQEESSREFVNLWPPSAPSHTGFTPQGRRNRGQLVPDRARRCQGRHCGIGAEGDGIYAALLGGNRLTQRPLGLAA